jgi:hypothetical protein
MLLPLLLFLLDRFHHQLSLAAKQMVVATITTAAVLMPTRLL